MKTMKSCELIRIKICFFSYEFILWLLLLLLLLLCRECTLSEEEIAEIQEQCALIKAEGNSCFASNDYEGAVEKYTVLHDV